MFEKIPEELKALNQWVSVALEENPNPKGKAIKVPYISGTEKKASTTTNSSWRSFEDALADVVSGKYPHLGFIVTPPYVFIDLDDLTDPEQQKVYKRFNTYSQTSLSGNGVHVIAKGTFEGSGKHPSKPHAGLFKENRYILMTGAVIDNRDTITPVATEDLQSVHSWLSSAKEYPTTDLVEVESGISDDEIFAKGCARWYEFKALTEGNWQQFEKFNNDHSSADHDLICMLADLTPSNEQVRNLFSRSGMWNSEREHKKKGLDRYVNYTIAQIRGKQAENHKRFGHISLDFSEDEPEQIQERGSRAKIDSLPEGLIKRMADWIWNQSKYPLQEAALSAAFSIISTVAGRNYQTHGSTPTGLNLWFILVAGTGTGKNEYQNGISKIVKKVSDANKFGSKFFHLFGGNMVSGPAMEDALAESNRCFTYFPEFAGTYRDLTARTVQPHHATLRDSLLNVFMQSGEENYLQRRRKAKQKGEEVDTTAIQAPCLVLGGECTEKKLDECMSASDLSGGFLQRFNILYADKASISRFSNTNNRIPMPEDLVEELLEFFVYCDQLAASGEFVTVPANEKASKMLSDYDHIKRGLTLDGENETINELYNRSGIKAIRLASQLAVSADFRNPMLTEEHAKWAMEFEDEGDARLLVKLTSGEIGSGQSKQEAQLMAVFEQYEKMSTAARKKAGIPATMAPHKNQLPHAFLKSKVVMLSAFQEDRNGSVTAFERCLVHLVNTEKIVKVDLSWCEDHDYGTKNVWCLV